MATLGEPAELHHLFFCCTLNPLLGVCVRAALSRTADLLGLNSEQLAEVLTHRSMILRGEEISTPLTVEQVSHRSIGGGFDSLLSLSSLFKTNQRECQV